MSTETSERQVVRASCFLCHLNCGVLVTKEDGRIVDIKGDPDNPHNEGYVCARLEQGRWKDFEYNPNRLKKPLKRVGERGAAQWEEISWDQALDEIADKLAALREQYGAETLSFLEGTYRTQSNLHYKFTNLFGSPNTGGNGTICYSSDMWLEPCTYGGFCSDKSDWKRADLVVLWGRNPAASELLNWQWTLKNMQERGAKLIVIDPRFYPYCNAPLLFRQMISGDPYPIKACIVQADNPMLAFPNTKLVHEALTSLDLLVVHDYFMTPTAALADYVLPAATWLERCSIGYPTMDVEQLSMAGSMPALERFEGGADVDFRDDYEFWYGLSERLGTAEKWWGPKYEDMLNDQVAPFGLKFQDFCDKVKYLRVPNKPEKYKEEGFRFLTPTGKVELYSTIIEQLGEQFDPLPSWEFPPYFPEADPEYAAEYPLSMITGARFMPFYHTEHRQPGAYRDLHPDPVFDIHPDTAMALNIAPHDWCWIETHKGRIKQRARLTTIVDPRVISVQHDWWFPEKDEAEPSLFGVYESNVNVILDDDPKWLDPLMGSWPLTGVQAKVYKCEEQ